jgi:hypothetical protein
MTKSAHLTQLSADPYPEGSKGKSTIFVDIDNTLCALACLASSQSLTCQRQTAANAASQKS